MVLEMLLLYLAQISFTSFRRACMIGEKEPEADLEEVEEAEEEDEGKEEGKKKLLLV